MRCYSCGVETNSLASILCPQCHAREVAHLELQGTLPVGGTSCPPEYELLPISTRSIGTELTYKLNRIARNGRVIRKGTQFS